MPLAHMVSHLKDRTPPGKKEDGNQNPQRRCPTKCNIYQKSVIPSFAAGKVRALQKFGDFVPEENLEVAYRCCHVFVCISGQVQQTLPGCPILSGHPRPFPLSSDMTACHLDRNNTSVFLCRLLDQPQRATQREGTGETGVFSSAVPLGWAHWHTLPSPGVQGDLRAAIRAESATLPGSLSLCLPHRPMCGNEMS